MGIGDAKPGLYFISLPCRLVSFLVTSSVVNDIMSCHKRFGHASLNVLQHVDSLNVGKKKDFNISSCPVCPKAKIIRNPFPISSSRAATSFDLVHADVWGTYHCPTHDSKRLFLTLVDDFFRVTWVHLMQFKSDVAIVIEDFVAMIETQFRKRIMCLTTDNGKEFVNENMNRLLSDKGITHQSCFHYTPQQNGRDERKHKHLLEIARVLKLQGSILNIFWGACILTACYLINLIPTRLLGVNPLLKC